MHQQQLSIRVSHLVLTIFMIYKFNMNPSTTNIICNTNVVGNLSYFGVPTLGRPIFWSLSQKIKQLHGRSVGCVN